MKQKADLAQDLLDISSSPFAWSILGGKLHIKDAAKQDHPTRKPPKKLQPKQHSPIANPKPTFQHSGRKSSLLHLSWNCVSYYKWIYNAELSGLPSWLLLFPYTLKLSKSQLRYGSWPVPEFDFFYTW